MTDRKLRVFLCHAREDKPVVRELYRQLTAEGWMDVWLDEEKLYPGQDWSLEIEKAVRAAQAVIVCTSKNSTTKEGYVQRELRLVLDVALNMPEETIFVIPLRLEDCDLPVRLRSLQYANYFEGDRERAYKRLLVSLKMRAEGLGIHTAETLSETPREVVIPKQEASSSYTELQKPWIERPTRPPEKAQAKTKLLSRWPAIFWLMLAWAIAQGIFYLGLAPAMTNQGVVFALCGAMGGFATGYVLQKALTNSNRSFGLWMMLIFAGSSVTGFLIGLWSDPGGTSSGYLAAGILSGAIGGLGAGLVLWRQNMISGWPSVLWVAMGWMIGLALIGGSVGLLGLGIYIAPISFPAGGALAGLIGGVIMFWRIGQEKKIE